MPYILSTELASTNIFCFVDNKNSAKRLFCENLATLPAITVEERCSFHIATSNPFILRPNDLANDGLFAFRIQPIFVHL